MVVTQPWSAGLPHLVNLKVSADRPVEAGSVSPPQRASRSVAVVCHPTASQNQSASQHMKVRRLAGCCLTARLRDTGQSGRWSSGGLWQSRQPDSRFSRTKAESRVTQPDQSVGHSQFLPVVLSPLVTGSSGCGLVSHSHKGTAAGQPAESQGCNKGHQSRLCGRCQTSSHPVSLKDTATPPAS